MSSESPRCGLAAAAVGPDWPFFVSFGNVKYRRSFRAGCMKTHNCAILLLVFVHCTAWGGQWADTNRPYRAAFNVPRDASSRVLVMLEAPELWRRGSVMASAYDNDARPLPMEMRCALSNRLWAVVDVSSLQDRSKFYVYCFGTEPPVEIPLPPVSNQVECTYYDLESQTPPTSWEQMQYMYSTARRSGRPDWLESFHLTWDEEGRRRRGQRLVVMRGYIQDQRAASCAFAVRAGATAFVAMDGRPMAADTEYGLDGADASSSTWSIGERVRLEPGPHLIELFGFLRSAGDEVEAGWIVEGNEIAITLSTESLLAGECESQVGFEHRDGELSPSFTYEKRTAYGIKDCDVAFVPVILRNTTASKEKVDFFWDFGDGSTEGGNSCTHIFEGGRSYEVSLTARAESGMERKLVRVVDCRFDLPSDWYRGSFELVGLPPICYADEGVKVTVRGSGELPKESLVGVEWKVRHRNGRIVSGHDDVPIDGTNIAPAAFVIKARAGQLASIDWKVLHYGVELEAGRTIFEKTPFAKLPVRAEGDNLYAEKGSGLVLIADRPWRSELTQLAPRGRIRNLAVIDDFLLDRMLSSERLAADLGVEVVGLRVPSADGMSRANASLARLVEAVDMIGPDTSAAVISIGANDILRGAGSAEFEKHLSALVDLIASLRQCPIILVTPPPYPWEPDKAREFATAITRIGLSRNIPVADVYTAFMCRSRTEGRLFDVRRSACSKRGGSVAIDVIGRAIDRLKESDERTR